MKTNGAEALDGNVHEKHTEEYLPLKEFAMTIHECNGSEHEVETILREHRILALGPGHNIHSEKILGPNASKHGVAEAKHTTCIMTPSSKESAIGYSGTKDPSGFAGTVDVTGDIHE